MRIAVQADLMASVLDHLHLFPDSVRFSTDDNVYYSRPTGMSRASAALSSASVICAGIGSAYSWNEPAVVYVRSQSALHL